MNLTDLSEDLQLAVCNLDQSIRRIGTGNLPGEQAEQLMSMLKSVFWRALPYFVEGSKSNPIHHNTQVLDNMVQIALGEQAGYREFKMSVVLALLHDIGNAGSKSKKVKTDEIKDATDASEAIAFRLEHMDNGPGLITAVAQPFLESGTVNSDDLHLICRAVLIHDYPSIEEILSKHPGIASDMGYASGDFLLPFDSTILGRLIERLREADRLYMVTEQGVLKDLRDAHAEPTAGNALAKLRSNAKKHRKEFLLYESVGRSAGFKDGTLYRTNAGYTMYVDSQELLEEKWSQLPEGEALCRKSR